MLKLLKNHCPRAYLERSEQKLLSETVACSMRQTEKEDAFHIVTRIYINCNALHPPEGLVTQGIYYWGHDENPDMNLLRC